MNAKVAKLGGGFLFIWMLWALGAVGAVTAVLAARALRAAHNDRRRE